MTPDPRAIAEQIADNHEIREYHSPQSLHERDSNQRRRLLVGAIAAALAAAQQAGRREGWEEAAMYLDQHHGTVFGRAVAGWLRQRAEEGPAPAAPSPESAG